jgi:hypothetical protein
MHAAQNPRLLDFGSRASRVQAQGHGLATTTLVWKAEPQTQAPFSLTDLAKASQDRTAGARIHFAEEA